tara:strand:+ start:22 stop:273 length:252 start_codon:yes stop_codon:yes gene_type:complete
VNIDNLNERLERIISDIFNCDASELTDSTGPGDIPQWDSLGHLTLMVEIQKRFGAKIPMEKSLEVESISDLAAMIKDLSMESD